MFITGTNKLVRFYDGCTGLKTGTTDKAGKCISASAERNGMRLVAVTLGSETSDDRFEAAKKLLDYGFSNFEWYNPEIDLAQLTPIKVKAGKYNSVAVTADAAEGFMIPKGMSASIVQTVTMQQELTAPVEAGQKAGAITFTLDGVLIMEIPIVTVDAVERMTFRAAYEMLVRMLFSLSIK